MGAEIMSRRSFQALWLIFAMLLANIATGQDAGEVIFVTGSVTAEREPPVALAKGDRVLVQDTIATGAASRVQLLMIDGARIAIRPLSRLRIEEYAFPSGEGAAPGQPIVTTSRDRSVTSLLKGGFRSITGAIGKDVEESYEVRTPVGVLGIRGTDYAAVFCRGDCNWAPGIGAAAPVEDGLYLGVNEGIVVFRNEFGDIEIRAGEFAFIPLIDRRLRRLREPPAVLLDDRDLDFGSDTAGPRPPARAGKPPPPDDTDDGSGGPPTDPDGSGTGFDSKLSIRRAPEAESAAPDSAQQGQGTDGTREPPEQGIIGTDPDGTPIDITPGDVRPQDNRTISYSTGPLGLPDEAFSGTQDNAPGEYQLGPGNELLGFVAPYPPTAAPDTGVFDIGSSSTVETGFDSVTVLRWGRWAGGSANITLTRGVDASQNLANQSIHWVSGPATAPPVMPIAGTANYVLIGGTSPTDNFGNIGVLGSATFQADFTRQTVMSTIDLNINNFNWMATGNGRIGAMAGLPPHLFQGMYTNVVITGAGGTFTGRGMFSGFFSQPGPASDPAFPGGVGMTYSLQDQGASTAVSGAVVFGNP